MAIKARYVISQKVKKSILYLVNEAGSKLKVDKNKMNPIFYKLAKIDRIVPEIHYFHHALQMAMRDQNKEKVEVYLNHLIHSIDHYTLSEELIPILTIGHSDWEQFSRHEAIRLAKEECHQAAEIEPITIKALFIVRNKIHEAIEIIAKHYPDMFDEISEQVSMIKVFQGKVTMGFTDVRMLGAMFIRIPRPALNPILYFFEHIIHEASHIHLNSLMTIDPLILNAHDERYVSPLRNDLRPMIGVFHATFVSARIARSLIKLYQDTGNQELLHPLAEILDETIRGVIEIEKHAKLTAGGSQLVNSIRKLLATAVKMSEWRHYDFLAKKVHRFGAGTTKVTIFQQAIA